jgi:hypothetical protein
VPTAMISVLKAGGHIKPHYGYYNGVLRSEEHTHNPAIRFPGTLLANSALNLPDMMCHLQAQPRSKKQIPVLWHAFNSRRFFASFAGTIWRSRSLLIRNRPLDLESALATGFRPLFPSISSRFPPIFNRATLAARPSRPLHPRSTSMLQSY